MQRCPVLIVTAAALVTGAAACVSEPQPYLVYGETGEASTSGGEGDGSKDASSSGVGSTGAGSTSGGTSGSQGRAFFDAHVLSMLDATCAPCHSSAFDDEGLDFLGSGPDVYYPSLEAIGYITLPENSWLLLKGAHTGPAWTPDQAATVTEWLEIEAEERGLVGGESSGAGGSGQAPPTKTLQDALAEFGNCMSLDDWQLLGMGNVANQNTTEGPCKSCHQTGTGGAFLSGDSTQTYEMNKQMPYILKLVLGTVNADGTFKDLVPANRFIDKGGEQGLHPKYIMTPERQLAIAAYFDATYDRWKAGNCN